ncbi:hypothetical protein NDU88_001897, partial [Pleurodeles waltl]
TVPTSAPYWDPTRSSISAPQFTHSKPSAVPGTLHTLSERAPQFLQFVHSAALGLEPLAQLHQSISIHKIQALSRARSRNPTNAVYQSTSVLAI